MKTLILLFALTLNFPAFGADIATGADDVAQEVLAKSIANYTYNHGEVFGKNALVLFDINQEQSEFEVSITNEEQNPYKAFFMKTFIQDKKVFLKLEASRSYLRHERRLSENKHLSRRELMHKIEMRLQEMLETINANI